MPRMPAAMNLNRMLRRFMGTQNGMTGAGRHAVPGTGLAFSSCLASVSSGYTLSIWARLHGGARQREVVGTPWGGTPALAGPRSGGLPADGRERQVMADHGRPVAGPGRRLKV